MDMSGSLIRYSNEVGLPWRKSTRVVTRKPTRPLFYGEEFFYFVKEIERHRLS